MPCGDGHRHTALREHRMKAEHGIIVVLAGHSACSYVPKGMAE